MNPIETAKINKELVTRVLAATFDHRDEKIIRQYTAEDYVQHNPHSPNGTSGISSFLAGLRPGFSYEAGMMVAEGDYVMVHGRYVGLARNPRIAVDIFRIVNSQIVEHWDVIQEEVPTNLSVSGNSMFTNPQKG